MIAGAEVDVHHGLMPGLAIGTDLDATCGRRARSLGSVAGAASGVDGMGKGDKQRGNKEAKKPKKETAKVSATADFSKGKSPLDVGGGKKK